MKPYFQKLLTEQERAGSRNRSAKWGGRVRYVPDSDYQNEHGGFIPWSRHRNHDHKSLTDVLGPLRGYLHANTGRPWDEVYSEICAGMDRRSTTGAHIFTHLWQFVDRNTILVNGYVLAWSQWGRLQAVDEWYVHPVTGLLCYEPRCRIGATPQGDPNVVPIDERTEYRRIAGIWYHTEFAWTERGVYHARWAAIGFNPWKVTEDKIIVRKRQLGRRELRKHNLRNQ